MKKIIIGKIGIFFVMIFICSNLVSCANNLEISYTSLSKDIVLDLSSKYISKSMNDKLSFQEYLKDEIQLSNSISNNVYHLVEIEDQFIRVDELNAEVNNLCFFGEFDSVFSYMYQSGEKATINLWAANKDDLTNPYVISWTVEENVKQIFHINSLSDAYNLTHMEYVGVLLNDGSVKIYKQKPMESKNISKIGQQAQVEDYFYVRNALDGVESVWGTNDGFAYIKEDNLYVYSLATGKKTLIKEHCGKIKDVSVAENDQDGRYYLLYVDQKGDLYGFGRNLAYVISQEEPQNTSFSNPIQIKTVPNLKQVHLSNAGEAYFLDEKGNLFFAGLASKFDKRELLRNGERNNLEYSYFYKKSEYRDSFIKEIKNKDDIIYTSLPLKVATDINYLNKGSLYKNLVLINKRNEAVSCSVKRNNEKSSGDKYYVESRVIYRDVKKLFDSALENSNGEVSFYIHEFYSMGKTKLKQTVLPRKYWWETIEMENPNFYSPTVVTVNNKLKNILTSSFESKDNIKKYVWINNQQGNDRVGIFLNNDGQLTATITSKTCCNYYDFPHFSYKFKGFNGYVCEYGEIDIKEKADEQYEVALEKDVDYFWADEYGVAYVKDNKLFSCGAMEYYRPYIYELEDITDRYTDNKPKPLYPPYAVEYDGIDVEKVKEVRFDEHHIYITMKTGEAYKILPKQNKNVGYYENVRKVDKRQLIKKTNVVDCCKNFILYNNSEADVLVHSSENNHNGIGNTIGSYRIKDVKKIVVGWNEDVYLCLYNDGTLYGWGNNCANTISSKNESFYDYKNRILIKRNVNDIELNGDGLYILDNKNCILFRGYNGRLNRKAN